MALALCLVAAPAASAQTTTNALDWPAACASLRHYQYPSNDALLARVEQYLIQASPDQRAQAGSSFLAMLREAAVTDDAKRFICQQAVYWASDAAVKVLVDLQADPKFSLAACQGLQQIPRAQAAVREVLERRTGRQRVEIIQMLAAWRDREAVPMLVKDARSADREVARAAVVALGEMGNPAAAQALADLEPGASADLQETIADARLKAASQLGGAAATAIYQHYLTAAAPGQRAAAYQGLLPLQPIQRNARLLEAITGNDPVLKAVAFREARRSFDTELNRLLAEALPALPSREQAILLSVLRERKSVGVQRIEGSTGVWRDQRITVMLAPVLKLAGSAEAEVRREAYLTLGVLGNADHADVLVRAAAKEQVKEQTSARQALARLPGWPVDPALMKLAEAGAASERKESILALVARRSESAAPLLLRLAEDPEPVIRREAIQGLGKLARPAEYPELVQRLLKANTAEAQQGYREALVKVCQRAVDPERGLEPIRAALNAMSGPPSSALLEVLAGVGTPPAAIVLLALLQSPAPEIRQAGLRALADWPNADPVRPVLDWMRGSTDPAARGLAVPALISMIGNPSPRPAEQTVVLLAETMALAAGPEQKKPVLTALAAVNHESALALAVQSLSDPALEIPAATAVCQIATRLAKSKPAAAAAAVRKILDMCQSPAARQLAEQWK